VAVDQRPASRDPAVSSDGGPKPAAVRRKERTLVATTTERRIHYLHAGAERLRFTDEVFDLVFAMSMRHWTDQVGGIAGIGRVLTLTR
jgi:ubiquinone/menaquinone biosynthesis C-methylase UbiE